MGKMSCLIIVLLLITAASAFAGIYNVHVTNITKDSAVIQWQTTVDATTELALGKAGGPLTDLPKLLVPPSQNHSYPVSGLMPDTEYEAIPRSIDETSGEQLLCDDGSSPVYFTTLSAVLGIEIDIKPGSDPNCFNIDGHGVIPVAIMGSVDLNVHDIVVGSLSFGGLSVRVRGKKGPLSSFDDINSDGFLDLICQFEDDTSNWIIGTELEATLEGELLDGTRIEGSDEICIVP
jgi:hypothetical protein